MSGFAPAVGLANFVRRPAGTRRDLVWHRFVQPAASEGVYSEW
jgi:hypothetical protein